MRKDSRHTEETRDRIKTTQLINRLQGFALGERDPATRKPIYLEPHQVRAIDILLKKRVPDLQAVHTTTHTDLSFEDWIDQLPPPAPVKRKAPAKKKIKKKAAAKRGKR